MNRSTRLLRHLLALLLALAVLVVSFVATAGPATDFMRDKQERLNHVLEESEPDDEKLDAIFDEMLDYDELARASLGDEWAKLKDAQKKEFTDLLKELVRRAYKRNLKQTLDYDVTYRGEREIEPDRIRVDVTATSKTDKRAKPVELAYLLVHSGQSFKIVDVINEGVSLVSSYKSQFLRVIRESGYDGLIKKMRERIAKG